MTKKSPPRVGKPKRRYEMDCSATERRPDETLPQQRGGRDTEAQALLAYALAEDVAHAQSLADDLGKRLPKDTAVQLVWLPTIREFGN